MVSFQALDMSTLLPGVGSIRQEAKNQKGNLTVSDCSCWSCEVLDPCKIEGIDTVPGGDVQSTFRGLA